MILKKLSCAAVGVWAFGTLPAHAVTIAQGTSSGNEINFDDLTGSNFKTGKTKVSIDILGGNLLEGSVNLTSHQSYSIYDHANPALDQGNDIYTYGSCSFGSGPIACDDGFGGPTPNYLSNFLVGLNHIEYVVDQPASYDKCGSVYDVVCSEKWTSQHGFFVKLTNPASYKVTYSSLNAVPEPASWAMMITGFGLVGAAARRRKQTVTMADRVSA